MKAIILSIGDELVSGQALDTNSADLARRLGELGVAAVEHRTVGDDRRAIAAALTAAAAAADVVLVTGGLGPTADDLTRQALADAMGAELVLDRERLAESEAVFRGRGRTMQPANRIQAMVPAGATSMPNPLGTAPGIAARLGRADVYVLPGVPHEMQRMFDECIAPRLVGQGAVVHRRVHCFGKGESDIAAGIAELMERGRNPAVGTTASAGMITVRVAARGASRQEAQDLAERTVAEVRRRLGNLAVGLDEQTMPAAVGHLLRQAEATLATAESCTGGLIGELITSVAGSSDYYLGGVVAYGNDAKCDLLAVPEGLIRQHGAVSESVAAAMAEGCRKRFGADWAVSVTGIAGPSGGSEDKPVGLVYIGLAGAAGTQVHRHILPVTRDIVRLRAALTALDHLRLALMGQEA
ncbi:MAG: competence/damage-inducible protein A [Phycisphaerae bacterium]|nr:competence/damage-inducible protein A [Phycisphaerae bacterium]